MIEIDEKVAQVLITTLEDFLSDHEVTFDDPDYLAHRNALWELQKAVEGWFMIINYPQASELGSRVQVMLKNLSRERINAVLIRDPDQRGKILFSRLGTKEDDKPFTEMVDKWRFI